MFVLKVAGNCINTRRLKYLVIRKCQLNQGALETRPFIRCDVVEQL